MTSNTSKGRGQKGSKFWIQTLVNLDHGNTLQKEINRVDPSIGKIKWLSPLKKELYAELKANKIDALQNADLSFWSPNSPWWDAVAINENGSILLVEAKGHPSETETKCTASNTESIKKIKNTMREVCGILSYQMNTTQSWDEDVWYNKYYQMGNRLSFLIKLRQQHYDVKLVLINLINDSTHIAVSEEKWKEHYRQVFWEMIGTGNLPDHVLMMNIDVG